MNSMRCWNLTLSSDIEVVHVREKNHDPYTSQNLRTNRMRTFSNPSEGNEVWRYYFNNYNKFHEGLVACDGTNYLHKCVFSGQSN